MATSIRLATETEQRLDSLSSRTGRTKAYYLRQIIENGLDELEDYYLAAEIMERVRMEERMSPRGNPRSIGKVLTGPLIGFWCYRVGNYRIICDIQNDTLCVLVVEIGHRREVYR